MKIQEVWLNLPVKNMEKAKTFYKKIGFKSNPLHEHVDHLASFLIGRHNFVMMLFPEDAFKQFTQNDIADTAKGTELLINIDAQSRNEVDQMADIVRKAGGIIYAEPGESQGWLYAFGFSDPDGHRWCVLHMDPEKNAEIELSRLSSYHTLSEPRNALAA